MLQTSQESATNPLWQFSFKALYVETKKYLQFFFQNCFQKFELFYIMSLFKGQVIKVMSEFPLTFALTS